MVRKPPEGGGFVGLGCGVVFGALVFVASFAFLEVPWWAGAAFAIVIGALAYRFGDRFWYPFLERLGWFS